jgi:glycosyltransferase involved in cell wall biosynthesis
MMLKITAIIPTFNEEAHISAAIQSVDWADEIIVVDSFSTDKTPELAKKNSRVKFIQHEYVNSASQKNWIIPQATHEWIFLLDADERVTLALREELKSFQRGERAIAEMLSFVFFIETNADTRILLCMQKLKPMARSVTSKAVSNIILFLPWRDMWKN